MPLPPVLLIELSSCLMIPESSEEPMDRLHAVEQSGGLPKKRSHELVRLAHPSGFDIGASSVEHFSSRCI
jgi:hypothetical protein